MTSLIVAPAMAAREFARTPTGRFGNHERTETTLPSLGDGYSGDDGRFALGDDGECPTCGHLQEPGSPCETCDPSCAECLGPRQDYDTSLCDDCVVTKAEGLLSEYLGDSYYDDLYAQEAV